MKSFIYLIIATLFIALGGCKNYLNKLPEDTLPTVSINYTDLSLMYQPVSGIYRIAESENPGFVHWADLAIRAVRGDDLDKGSSPNDQGDLNDVKNFHNTYANVQNFWMLNNSWNNYYGLIIDANAALIELDKFAANIPASDNANLTLNKQYMAEIRFFRAYSHLIISREFGAVPILTDNSTLTTIGKSSVADIRKWISTEMDYCIANLEDKRPNQASHVGAVTKYTAYLLKAKVSADLAGTDNASSYWTDVVTSTDAIISSGLFSLYPDYYNLFKYAGRLCNESLFELQFGTENNVRPGAFWDFQGPRGDQRGSPISGWGFSTPSEAIVAYLTGRNDTVRLRTTILRAGATDQTFSVTSSGDKIYGNGDGLKYFNGKAYLPVIDMYNKSAGYGERNNVRVLRFADVLLLNAEAKIRKGQSGDIPFNLVRTRAKLSSITGATVNDVLDERRAEFACEWWGERYNDLIRTGTAATALSAYGFVAGQSEYLPIPLAQQAYNP
ncbi:MAG TPA: RagB/SusD family nutrient uptake outer membrane protein, partial [Prolixibacteraceae bacterium]